MRRRECEVRSRSKSLVQGVGGVVRCVQQQRPQQEYSNGLHGGKRHSVAFDKRTIGGAVRPPRKSSLTAQFDGATHDPTRRSSTTTATPLTPSDINKHDQSTRTGTGTETSRQSRPCAAHHGTEDLVQISINARTSMNHHNRVVSNSSEVRRAMRKFSLTEGGGDGGGGGGRDTDHDPGTNVDAKEERSGGRSHQRHDSVQSRQNDMKDYYYAQSSRHSEQPLHPQHPQRSRQQHHSQRPQHLHHPQSPPPPPPPLSTTITIAGVSDVDGHHGILNGNGVYLGRGRRASEDRPGLLTRLFSDY